MQSSLSGARLRGQKGAKGGKRGQATVAPPMRLFSIIMDAYVNNASFWRNYEEIRCLIPSVMPEKDFSRKAKKFFGLSLVQITLLYTIYFDNSGALTILELLVTLHWLRHYPEWLEGVFVWGSLFASDRTYRTIVSRGIYTMKNVLKEVR